MPPQQRLNEVLIEWDKCAEAFERAVQDAARSAVEWERYAARERARLKAEATAEGIKLTVPDLDAAILNGDKDGLLLAARLSDAVVTGLRKRLDVFQAQADAARSEIASERAQMQAWGASPSVPR